MQVKENWKDKWAQLQGESASDLQSAHAAKFAENWADGIEARIAAGEKLEDCAEDVLTDLVIAGLQLREFTGFEVSALVSFSIQVLGKVWQHGEEFMIKYMLVKLIKQRMKAEIEEAKDEHEQCENVHVVHVTINKAEPAANV